MAQGIIQVSPSAVEDFIDLTIDPALINLSKLKEVLLLPDRYTVEQVRHREFCILNGYVEVIVSSPDIPEIEESAKLPYVSPCYCYEHISEDGKTRTFFLSDILIDGVSVIRGEDKERKATMEIKEVKDAHVNARDTQFQGFAKLLMRDLDAVNTTTYASLDKAKEAYELVIARRLYDFAKHAFYELDIYRSGSLDRAVQCIPDLNKWPKEEEYA